MLLTKEKVGTSDCNVNKVKAVIHHKVEGSLVYIETWDAVGLVVHKFTNHFGYNSQVNKQATIIGNRIVFKKKSTILEKFIQFCIWNNINFKIGLQNP